MLQDKKEIREKSCIKTELKYDFTRTLYKKYQQ